MEQESLLNNFDNLCTVREGGAGRSGGGGGGKALTEKNTIEDNLT